MRRDWVATGLVILLLVNVLVLVFATTAPLWLWRIPQPPQMTTEQQK
jgi:hypothetical protein